MLKKFKEYISIHNAILFFIFVIITLNVVILMLMAKQRPAPHVNEDALVALFRPMMKDVADQMQIKVDELKQTIPSMTIVKNHTSSTNTSPLSLLFNFGELSTHLERGMPFQQFLNDLQQELKVLGVTLDVSEDLMVLSQEFIKTRQQLTHDLDDIEKKLRDYIYQKLSQMPAALDSGIRVRNKKALYQDPLFDAFKKAQRNFRRFGNNTSEFEKVFGTDEKLFQADPVFKDWIDQARKRMVLDQNIEAFRKSLKEQSSR